MATPIWQPTTMYSPGALVQRRTAVPATIPQIVNGDFEAGDTGWAKTTDPAALVSIVRDVGRAFAGEWCVRFETLPGGTPGDRDGSIHASTPVGVSTGGRLTLNAMINVAQGGHGASARAVIQFLDGGGLIVGTPTEGSVVTGQGVGYRPSTVTANVPAGAVTARAAVYFNDSAEATLIFADNLGWSYVAPGSSAIQFKAVQGAPGYSGGAEPTWPTTLGGTVVDGEVTWEAVQSSRVVWQARAVLRSGEQEPSWPLQHGAFVSDGTVSWEAVDLRVVDPNCPNTKVVVIAKSKIYAGDGDVVRYSGTLAPTDWSSPEDAGYIGTGLHQNGANQVAVLNVYRGNLVVMNSAAFQQWNIDPDPALMDLLDAMDGIGSSWHLAAQPVANDLFYLSALGVRTIGLSGASNNLKAGDVGLPVDPLVQALVRESRAQGEEPLGMYYPASGQYWLVFNRRAYNDGSGVSPIELCPALEVGDRYAEVMVYTLNQIGQVGAWTRYVFPFAVDYAVQRDDDLFVRDGNNVYRLSEHIGATDDLIDLAMIALLTEEDGLVIEPEEAEVALVTETSEIDSPAAGELLGGDPFAAVLWWPHLDMGRPGADKTMESFDIVGYGDMAVEVGYNQRDVLALTEPYNVIEDTLDGTPVPLTITAPTMSFRLTYNGWDPANPATEKQRFWEFNAMGINIT